MRSRRSKAVAGATAALMVLTANIALADVADNNALDASGNTTIEAGGTTTIRYWIEGKGGDGGPQGGGQGNCNARPESPLTVAIDAPSAVTATPSSLTFTACGDEGETFQTVTFSSTAPGSYSVNHVVTDTSSGTTSNAANFTLTVTPATPIDTTPPVITATVAGTLGSNGWYTSDVDLTWTVTDAESAISNTTGCDPVTITADQGSTTYTCTATSAGGTNSESVAIKRDATPPVITPGDVTDSTWRNTSVSADFDAVDATSGLAMASDAEFTLTASEESADASTPTTVSKTVTDNAGNNSTRTVSALIDLTAPTSQVDGVTEGATYVTPPNVTCLATDGLSGVVSHGSPSGATTSAGSKSVTCNGATDLAGNTQTVASPAVNYTLIPMGGFNSNFDGGAVLKVKPNQAIPLKWAFNDGTVNHDLLSSATLSSVSSNGCSAGERIDGTEIVTEVAAGASGLQLHTDNSYQMNWKATSTTGCRALTVNMNLKDGGSVSRTILVNIAK